MVNGMPGPMATAAAEACLRKGLKLCPFALTGPDIERMTISVVDTITERKQDVDLIPSSQSESVIERLNSFRSNDASALVLVIDYTHPSAVNSNARFYVQNKLPFVLGTTGGDRNQLSKDVANHWCVIAPNMGKQIVALQEGLSYLAGKYPGAFAGYELKVVESHQATKADTSGTAKAVVDSIKTLAADPSYSYDDIVQIRDEQESLNFGVPAGAMKGHAYHTYTLTSPDGSVNFQLQHNVVGRTVYAEGTADAVRFLGKKIQEAVSSDVPRVFNMMDVLAEGALE